MVDVSVLQHEKVPVHKIQSCCTTRFTQFYAAQLALASGTVLLNFVLTMKRSPFAVQVELNNFLHLHTVSSTFFLSSGKPSACFLIARNICCYLYTVLLC
jgi:hypothetical protein